MRDNLVRYRREKRKKKINEWEEKKGERVTVTVGSTYNSSNVSKNIPLTIQSLKCCTYVFTTATTNGDIIRVHTHTHTHTYTHAINIHTQGTELKKSLLYSLNTWFFIKQIVLWDRVELFIEIFKMTTPSGVVRCRREKLNARTERFSSNEM